MLDAGPRAELSTSHAVITLAKVRSFSYRNLRRALIGDITFCVSASPAAKRTRYCHVSCRHYYETVGGRLVTLHDAQIDSTETMLVKY